PLLVGETLAPGLDRATVRPDEDRVLVAVVVELGLLQIVQRPAVVAAVAVHARHATDEEFCQFVHPNILRVARVFYLPSHHSCVRRPSDVHPGPGLAHSEFVSTVTWSAVVRYAEVDQQGVVFNAHYLTYCDEAMGLLCAQNGLLDIAERIQLVSS